jgi:NAD(P)-dependent dehydrogenase (short-subunit alcohol dehydrogenase family)
MSPLVAIITGAAQGLGRSIAHRLAHDGFHVAVNDIPSKRAKIIDLVEAIKNQGGMATAVPADISSEKQVKRMIRQTVSQLGRLDVVSDKSSLSIHLADFLRWLPMLG